MGFDINQIVNFWFNLLLQFKDLGPIAPIVLVMVESFLPILPLILIVTFIISAYGVFWGFTYALLGNILGSLIVFFTFRFFKHQKFMSRIVHRKRVEVMLNWVLRQHPSFLIFLVASPFTPSSFVNISFGLSGYSKRLFSKSLIIGKIILMIFLVWFGHSVNVINEKPYLVVLALLGYGLAYYISQKYGKVTGEEN